MALLTVAIDASSTVTGGGVTYLRQLLPMLAKEADLRIGPILVRAESGEARDSVIGFGEVLVGKGRMAALSPRWKGAVTDSSVDVVFAPTEISFSSYKQPLLLALRNPCIDPRNLVGYSARHRTRWAVQRRLARMSVCRADAYIAVSKYAQSIGERWLGIDPSRVTVVYHGSQAIGPRRPIRPCRRFLLVSNLYRYKNLETVIEAFAAIEGNWVLDVAGRFIERDYECVIRSLILDRRLSDRVRLLGHQSAQGLAKLYGESDCLVWPSYAETFGHPLLEARSHGLPVIAAAAASNPEIVGEAAVYFAPRDVARLRELLVDAMAHGISTGALPRSYAWERCGVETAAVLRELTLR